MWYIIIIETAFCFAKIISKYHHFDKKNEQFSSVFNDYLLNYSKLFTVVQDIYDSYVLYVCFRKCYTYKIIYESSWNAGVEIHNC